MTVIGKPNTKRKILRVVVLSKIITQRRSLTQPNCANRKLSKKPQFCNQFFKGPQCYETYLNNYSETMQFFSIPINFKTSKTKKQQFFLSFLVKQACRLEKRSSEEVLLKALQEKENMDNLWAKSEHKNK